MTDRYRLIILGAGFSRPAGLPLAVELWQEIRRRAAHLTGRAARFHDDLKAYIEYRRDCDGIALTPDTVDFEDFMKFLDIEHFLGLRGSDTWSEDGNEGTIVTKTLIGGILAYNVNLLDQIPELYLEFARRLRPDDTVITFNYDTLLERALDAVGKPYRLFPSRFESVADGGAIVESDSNEVVVLKMHGSIDWFDRRQFEWLKKLRAKAGLPPPEDIVFSYAKELGLQPIVDGPRFEHDPLKTVYRATNLRALYQKRLMFLATPRMLPPSAAKIVYAASMNDFWNGMGEAGILNFSMCIIGFSLPPQDDYARQIIHTLVTNYQNHYWGKKVLNKMKSPLVIVDLFTDADSRARLKQRYGFVDWGRAIVHEGGFGVEELDSIFM